MKHVFDLYYKATDDDDDYNLVGRFPTIGHARAASHGGDVDTAFAHPNDWRECGASDTLRLNDAHTARLGRTYSPWLIEMVPQPETDAERIELAVDLAFEYANLDGAYHKQWVIDQMLRLLLGDGYTTRVEQEQQPTNDDDDDDEWDTGVAP